MSGFGERSTADEVLADKNLSGKTAFITGGYSGLGFETARAMAAKGAHVIIAGRDADKLEEAVKDLREQTGADVDTAILDLASLDSVRTCAREACSRFEKIDLLINNAGVMACPKGVTADGFETQFGVNHLGHFVLTKGLVPLVMKGDGPRIVNLSSRAHHIDQVGFGDINYEEREYTPWGAYGQSKTANALFAAGLDKRLKSHGIRAFSVHPGGIMTNLGRHLSEADQAQLIARLRAAAEADGKEPQAFKTIPQGAATTCWAATADGLDQQGGAYCEDCHVADVDDESRTSGVRSYAVDGEKADRLWALSEEMTGESFAV